MEVVSFQWIVGRSCYTLILFSAYVSKQIGGKLVLQSLFLILRLCSLSLLLDINFSKNGISVGQQILS